MATKSNKPVAKTATVEETVETNTNNDSLKEIKALIARLQQENEELRGRVEKVEAPVDTESLRGLPFEYESTEEEYPEPPLNKSIKVISLFYGALNLSDGRGGMLSFSQYGQAKNCLYGKLIDIVNNHMKFAKGGYFYIADKASVYHLGLTDDYKRIQPKEVLDNICTYDDKAIKNIGNSLTAEQKENLSIGIAKRMYDGENFDLNKVRTLSDAIGISIEDICKEMKDTK